SSTIKMCSPAMSVDSEGGLAPLPMPPRIGCARKAGAQTAVRSTRPWAHALCLDRRGGARHGHLDDEPAAARLVVLDMDRAAVLGHDLPDDRQPEPHARGLGREVGQKELLLVLRTDAGPGVGHDDPGVRSEEHTSEL